MRNVSLAAVAVMVLAACLPGCKEQRMRAQREEYARQAHIAKLKSWVPAEYAGKVDPDFFTYPGFRDWFRFPLVYPYSINMVDDLQDGALVKVGPNKRIASGGAWGAILGRLSHIAFNDRYMVGRVNSGEKWGTPKPEDIHWVLFEFASGESKTFPTEEEALAAAREVGFDSDTVLLSVEEQYNRCF